METPDEAGTLRAEAFREGQVAVTLDEKNVEANAVMVFNHFRLNDFGGAYPYARTLIDNLPADERGIDLDDFNDYLIGASYVLALKDLQNNHPDEALKDIEASSAREKSPARQGPARAALAVGAGASARRCRRRSSCPAGTPRPPRTPRTGSGPCWRNRSSALAPS